MNSVAASLRRPPSSPTSRVNSGFNATAMTIPVTSGPRNGWKILKLQKANTATTKRWIATSVDLRISSLLFASRSESLIVMLLGAVPGIRAQVFESRSLEPCPLVASRFRLAEWVCFQLRCTTVKSSAVLQPASRMPFVASTPASTRHPGSSVMSP